MSSSTTNSLLHILLAPGIRIFSSLRFAAKLMLITVITTGPLIGLLLYSLANEADQALEARKDATRQHVEVAYGVLEWAYAQQISGELDEAQAQTPYRQWKLCVMRIRNISGLTI